MRHSPVSMKWTTTPVGKRWGDVIRRELSDPDSELSMAVRAFNAWKRLCKNDPELYQMSVDCLGYISVKTKSSFGPDNIQSISSLTDVRYLFGKD